MINRKKIFVRHPYLLKGKKTLDLNLFKNDTYSKKTGGKEKFLLRTGFVILNIENSIHMKYLNNPIMYEKIYVDYISKTKQKEHSLEKFEELKKSFSLEKLKQNKILITKEEVNNLNSYIILDGCHRASIYFKMISKDLKSEFYEFT